MQPLLISFFCRQTLKANSHRAMFVMFSFIFIASVFARCDWTLTQGNRKIMVLPLGYCNDPP